MGVARQLLGPHDTLPCVLIDYIATVKLVYLHHKHTIWGVLQARHCNSFCV